MSAFGPDPTVSATVATLKENPSSSCKVNWDKNTLAVNASFCIKGGEDVDPSSKSHYVTTPTRSSPFGNRYFPTPAAERRSKRAGAEEIRPKAMISDA